MSVVILPSRWRNDAEPTPAGALAATMLSVAAASIAEPARLQRGRAYAKQNVVVRIEVEPGKLHALVAGSRPDPYEVVVEVDMIQPPTLGSRVERGDVASLCPDGRELKTRCSCPDWDDPCKHVIAALLVWADEVRTRPELLVEWRCSATAPAKRAGIGSRRATTPPQPAATPVETNSFAEPEWLEFFGSAAAALPDFIVTDSPIRVGTAMVGRTDIGPMLTDILSELS